MQVSIVIPNFNGASLLQKNLPSVLRAAPSAQIIVVDDCSTDDSVAVVKKSFPKVGIIQQLENKGFAHTVNYGVREAAGDIVVLLNTDVVPDKNFLAPLVKHFKDSAVFAVGCMDDSIENGRTVQRGRGIGAFKRGFLVHQRGEVSKTNTLWVSGGSGAFAKNIWQKLGGFDPLYSPFYWEDIDLSYRAQKMGFKVFFEPESRVEHRHEEGSIQDHHPESLIKRISYRNQFIFVWKNITDSAYVSSHWLWLPYHIGKALKNGDGAFFGGLWDALLQWRQIQKQHNKLTSLWKKTDTEVLVEYEKSI